MALNLSSTGNNLDTEDLHIKEMVCDDDFKIEIEEWDPKVNIAVKDICTDNNRRIYDQDVVNRLNEVKIKTEPSHDVETPDENSYFDQDTKGMYILNLDYIYYQFKVNFISVNKNILKIIIFSLFIQMRRCRK